MVPFSEKDLVAVNEKVQLEALKGFYGRWEDLVDISLASDRHYSLSHKR